MCVCVWNTQKDEKIKEKKIKENKRKEHLEQHGILRLSTGSVAELKIAVAAGIPNRQSSGSSGRAFWHCAEHSDGLLDGEL